MPFVCESCGRTQDRTATKCDCGGFVRYREMDTDQLRAACSGDPWAALPDLEDPVSMAEGDTALVDIEVDSTASVVAKMESLNPTCSFKDRGSALAVSMVSAPETSWERVVVASTGNTATSVAAYAARADIPCSVLVPEDTSLAKLSQVAAHGADVYTIDGSFSDCFRLAQDLRGERILNATAVYSANPFVASANRTVAFELLDQLGMVPDWITVPVGAGPLLGGTYFGFKDLADAGIVDSLPRMVCVQAEGCHPIVRAMEAGEPVTAWTDPITTDVGAIADPLIGYAEDGEHTRRVVEESDGTAVALPDDVVHEWTERLARHDGVYAEPASAAAAAVVPEVDDIAADDLVVPLITGHGLKEEGGTPDAVPLENDATAARDAILD